MTTALRPDAPPAALSRRRPGIGFWVVGYVFAITIAFSAVPAPLYVLYQARDHFGTLLVIGRIISGISIGMLTATAPPT